MPALHAKSREFHFDDNADVDLDKKKATDIGKRVRLLRLEKHWSQKQLAKKAGVTTNTIRSFERGTGKTRESTARDIVAALGKQLEDLRRQVDEVKPTDPQLRDLNKEDLLIANAFHHSSTRVRQQVWELLQEGKLPQADVEPTISGALPSPAEAAADEFLQDDERLLEEFRQLLARRERLRTEVRSGTKTTAPKLKRSTKG